MRISVTLEDKDNKETIIIENVSDRNSFDYVDTFGAFNHIEIYENGISIDRKDIDHLTRLVLTDNPHIEIISSEGTITFLTKVVEFNKNFDIITIVYKIDEDNRKKIINYLGE